MSDRFAHQLRIDQIRDGERMDIVADDEERAAVATRLGLPSLSAFDAHAVLSRTGAVVTARGRLSASLQQNCVVTGDPVAAAVDEPFEIRFTPAPSEVRPDDEIELAGDDCDVVFHDGSQIDLGGAIADTLALAIDPYPRSAGADAALKEAGVLSEEDASPFAVLAQLKRGDQPDT